MNDIKVEIGQYRPMDKGSLKAFFSVIIYPQGQKILDCRYFVQGDQHWFSFPQKEIKYTDGRKTEYIPLISYLNKEYLEQLKVVILNALKDVKPEATYERKKYSSDQKQKSSLQAESPPDWF